MRQPSLPRRRRQGGFIQGVILFALALIAVVIGVFSTSNSSVDTRTDREEARLNAALLLKVGSDIQDSVNRAVADQRDIATMVMINPPGDGRFFLWDPVVRYGSAPTLPITLRADRAVVPVWSVAYEQFTGQGSDTTEQVVQLSNVSDEVCRRLNASAQGVPYDPAADIPLTLAAVAALPRLQGCFAGTFYRVVSMDVAAPVAP